jgi:CheY-like chemotaxis protein
MPFKILIADDDESVRNSHKFALEAASDLLNEEFTVSEVDTSVDAWAKIYAHQYDLILVDNDFKDTSLKGHLPGIALLQLARKDGANKTTPIVFCSAETFEMLKPMVERFGCVHLPKDSEALRGVADAEQDLVAAWNSRSASVRVSPSGPPSPGGSCGGSASGPTRPAERRGRKSWPSLPSA